MSDIQSDPRQPLERRPFRFGCATDIFPMDEFGALTTRGHLMEALASGALAPTTPEHEHFLQVDRDEAEPTTLDERAWLRLKGRRELEGEPQKTPPPSPPQDYDIIEWDKEKCWW